MLLSCDEWRENYNTIQTCENGIFAIDLVFPALFELYNRRLELILLEQTNYSNTTVTTHIDQH